MGLTTHVDQPASVLREKLWKLVIKCEKVFLTFGHFFSLECTRFMFLINYFFLFASVAMKNEMVSFPIFIATIAMETNSFNTTMQFINRNYP